MAHFYFKSILEGEAMTTEFIRIVTRRSDLVEGPSIETGLQIGIKVMASTCECGGIVRHECSECGEPVCDDCVAEYGNLAFCAVCTQKTTSRSKER